MLSRTDRRSGLRKTETRRGLALALPLTALLAACTWVELAEGAKGVVIAQPDAVQDCRKLGTTTTSVLARVLFLDRSATRVADELATLARNEAVKMDGDTIVPTSPIQRGSQVWSIHRCRP